MLASVKLLLSTVLCVAPVASGSAWAQQPAAQRGTQDLTLVIQKLNDPGVQKRVAAAAQEAALAQLAKEGVQIPPELAAELAARAARKDDAANTLAAGAVFIATVALFSDERLKTNVHRIGSSPSGIPVYEFSYTGFSTRWRGAMAQDLLTMRPDAVRVANNGFLMVDYSLLDVPFENVE